MFSLFGILSFQQFPVLEERSAAVCRVTRRQPRHLQECHELGFRPVVQLVKPVHMKIRREMREFSLERRVIDIAEECIEINLFRNDAAH